MQEKIRVAYGKAIRSIRQNKKISQEELGDTHREKALMELIRQLKNKN